jgi:hypothetical protein
MRHLLFASAFVACASLACSTSYTVTDDLGDPCDDDTDCRDVCLIDFTAGTCSVRCDPDDPRACLPGWACGRTRDSDVVACRCGDPEAERCNGLDDDCDGAIDERLDCVVHDSFTIDVTPPSSVDLLFVIDNTMTMGSEHKALLRELPRMIRAVTSGDLDEDGRAERAPNEFLHVGVVTTDMGSGDFVVPTCDRRPFGDDGVLRSRGDLSLEGCETRYPSPTFFAFEPGADVDSFVETTRCVVSTGTNGCGFEQPLEAALKAVTRETSSIRFAEGSVGHADGANAGFLRNDSLLWIVILTEEDDCSIQDPSLFDPTSPTYRSDFNLRCMNHEEALHPIERFVDGLLATRADPSLLHVSLLAGLPPETDTPAGGAIDYDAILAHPLMQAEVDPEMPLRARPSCNRFDGWREWQVTVPPRRLVSTLRELERRGAHTSMRSLCSDWLTDAMPTLLVQTSAALGRCFSSLPPRAPDGSPSCRVIETAPASLGCAGPARVVLSRTPSEEVCEVALTASGPGWRFVPNAPGCASPTPHQIDIDARPGRRLELRCE